MQKHEKQDIKNMNVEQLHIHSQDLRKEIFLLRMKKFSSPEKNTALSKILRKQLAKALTVLRQKELHANQ
ncbi:50S ribosomal protein L29 [Candidatus Babeliales bacterium]|nr:50S ribosomal protein L29 [Candidatus Babeliales bacterium]